MLYLNSYYKIINSANNYFLFWIKSKNKKEYLNLEIKYGDILEKMNNLELMNINNEIFKVNNICVESELKFEDYVIKEISFILKFRNNEINPVSTLIMKCIKDEKMRNFSISLIDLEDYGYNLISYV
tara:strand:- start:19642 stop:20022 length:381 start_codon:yes stop_codon:yes gene_type:complete